MCAPVTGYAIPARVGVWGVWGGGSFPGSDLRLGFVAAAPLRFWGVGVFSGSEFGDGDHPDAFS